MEPVSIAAGMIEIATFAHAILRKAHRKLRVEPDEKAFLSVVQLSIRQVVEEIPGLPDGKQQAVFHALSELLTSVEARDWLGVGLTDRWPAVLPSKFDLIPAEFRRTEALVWQFRQRFWANLKAHAARADSSLNNMVSIAMLDNIARAVDGLVTAPPQAGAMVRPFQAPPRARWFAGRQRELAEIGTSVTTAGTPVVVISGRPGIGKTALATALAHDVEDHFRDGVLFVDLGAGPRETVAVGAIRDLLTALRVAPELIPFGGNALVGFYRGIIAERHCLLVLDNAHDEQQIRAFFPPRGDTAVVITTRYHSLGMAASRHENLDPLSDAEAVALFASASGLVVDQNNAAVIADVVHLCENVPLAVRLAASRLTSRRSWRPEDLRSRLLAHGGRMRVLRAGSLSMSSSLAVSYDGLGDQAQRALRLLAFARLPQLTSWTVAVLLGTRMDEAESVVDELDDASLLEELGPDSIGHDHFRLHDLVADFARERAWQHDSAQIRRAAVLRLLAAYSRMLDRGARTLEPDVYVSGPDVLLEPWSVEDADEDALIGEVNLWFRAQRPVLLSLGQLAEELEAWNHAWIVCYRLAYFLDYYAYWDDWERIQGVAASAAERLDDDRLRAYTVSLHGDLKRERGDFARAVELFDEALRLLDGSAAQADTYLRGRMLLGQGEAYRDLGMLGNAVGRLDAALAIFEDVPAPRYAAITRFGLGGAFRAMGDLATARGHLDQAQSALGGLGDVRGQAIALRSLGATERELGAFEAAEGRYHQCLVFFVEVGDRRYQAVTRRSIATLRVSQNRLAEARQVYAEAWAAFQELGDGRWAALSQVGLAAVLLFDEQLEQARLTYLSAVDVLARIGDRRWESIARLGLGVAHLANGDLARAREQVDLASALFVEVGDHRRIEVARTVRTLIDDAVADPAGLLPAQATARSAPLIDAMISD